MPVVGGSIGMLIVSSHLSIAKHRYKPCFVRDCLNMKEGIKHQLQQMKMSNKQLFQGFLGQTSAFPMALEVERATGIYLYGPDGKKYIDLISGIAVSALGHNHPKIVEAVQEQAARHMHVMVYGEFVQGPQVKLAKAIAGTLPKSLDNVFFVNSGSEANEGAMKLAKRYTGRHKVLACKNAYHGATHGTLSISSEELFKQAFMPLVPGVGFIEHGSLADLDQIDDETAAVFIEPVQGEAGVRMASKHYFEKLRQKCTQTGTMLVFDEIQSGFGRTGTFWAFEQYGIAPDILTCAKGMGGGMPLGAFIAPKAVMSVLQQDPVLGHITTFGGHPVSCAASLATLRELQQTNIYTLANQKAEVFKKHLKHPKIREIRNLGLMMAVQFNSFEQVSGIIGLALDLGLVTDWFLFCDNAIRVAPPLIISEAEIIEACDILLKAIDAS
jgi:putrescine aminotransferase